MRSLLCARANDRRSAPVALSGVAVAPTHRHRRTTHRRAAAPTDASCRFSRPDRWVPRAAFCRNRYRLSAANHLAATSGARGGHSLGSIHGFWKSSGQKTVNQLCGPLLASTASPMRPAKRSHRAKALSRLRTSPRPGKPSGLNENTPTSRLGAHSDLGRPGDTLSTRAICQNTYTVRDARSFAGEIFIFCAPR